MSTDDAPTVEDVFDEYVEDMAEDRPPDGCLHPSSLWMCDRQAVMQARGEPKTSPPDKQTMRVFKIGHLMHEQIQASLTAKYGDRVEHEFPIDAPHLAGHGDSILDGEIVYEFKSTRALGRIKKEGVPQETHVKQAATYAVSKVREGFKIREVHIVYFEKNNLEIVEFTIPYRPQWEAMVDDKVAALSPYLDQKKDEYPACTGPAWMRKYCSFYPSCDRATVNGKFQQPPFGGSPVPKKEFEW